MPETATHHFFNTISWEFHFAPSKQTHALPGITCGIAININLYCLIAGGDWWQRHLLLIWQVKQKSCAVIHFLLI